MTIATSQFSITGGSLPSLSAIRSNPHKVLPRLIHAQFGGLPRAHQDCGMLAEAIADAYIAVDNVTLPWRPMVTESLIDEILANDPACHESDAHRQLKIHARILALAGDSSAQLEPEAAAVSGRHPVRADLLIWHASGTSETIECGATDGRSILEQLLAGQIRVTVLPYASLGLPVISGYAFRLIGNPPSRALTAESGMQAWAQILAARPTSSLSSLSKLSI